MGTKARCHKNIRNASLSYKQLKAYYECFECVATDVKDGEIDLYCPCGEQP